jgi:hypothetical protein
MLLSIPILLEIHMLDVVEELEHFQLYPGKMLKNFSVHFVIHFI